MLKGDAHYSPFMGDNKPLSVGLSLWESERFLSNYLSHCCPVLML